VSECRRKCEATALAARCGDGGAAAASIYGERLAEGEQLDHVMHGSISFFFSITQWRDASLSQFR